MFPGCKEAAYKQVDIVVRIGDGIRSYVHHRMQTGGAFQFFSWPSGAAPKDRVREYQVQVAQLSQSRRGGPIPRVWGAHQPRAAR